jgi:hypothetical protein
MKALISTAILLAAILVQAQGTAKMTLAVNGTPVGTATLSQKFDKAGLLHQSLHMEVSLGTLKNSIDADSVTDRNGRPVSEKAITVQSGKKSVTTLTYGTSSLTITTTENGKTSTVKSAIPKGNLADASTMWFITTKPKPGAKATYLHFDKRTKQWQTKTATYSGDDTVPQTMKKGHHVHHEDGEFWLDAKGMPIRMELDENGVKLVMTRQ